VLFDEIEKAHQEDFPVETVAASRTRLTCRPAKHAAENTCTGPIVPFTIISEYFTDLIV
jgi:hypothetical protein